MSLALSYSFFHTHKMSDRIDRHIIDFLCRREEVVTYEAGGIGKKLGASAASKGLNAQEQAIYKRSLGDLCNQLIRASQTSLAATEERQKQRMVSSFGKVILLYSKLPRKVHEIIHELQLSGSLLSFSLFHRA